MLPFYSNLPFTAIKNTIMFANYSFTVMERFLRYVQVDTQSNPHSTRFPSTAKQKDLGVILVRELRALGVPDVHLDEYGYVYGTLPSNTAKHVPVICFCSHMDTSPDCSGSLVKPILHRAYDGSNIVLPDDHTQVITTKEHPYLLKKIGEDIITASGTTLLGADDKAGIAIIMDLVHYLQANPQVKHGAVKILFTPDEEIGRGVDKVDLKKLGADIGYTLDGGERGSYEEENFSANGFTVTFHGISAHPGLAKNKMVNAIKVAAAFLESLPKSSLSPETTEAKEGFVHPVHIEGIAEKVKLQFILRDFATNRLAQYENLLRGSIADTLKRYPGASAEVEITEQYRNMKEVLDNYPAVGANAKEAMKRAGVEFDKMSIRGGTDGARLSFMGLPCPNIFTGEMALHGKHEYVSVQDMQKSVETLVHLTMIWEEQS
jgi:tripeptide aminopeptidase